MTHDEIVKEIQARAARRYVLTHYCVRSEHCAAAKGMPDVLLAGPGGTAWLEVKTPASPDLKPGQTLWKYTLQASGQRWGIIREEDLAPGGAVDKALEYALTGIVP